MSTATASEALTPTVRQVVRRWRFWAVIAAIVVVIALVQLLGTGAAQLGATFDPDSAAPDGARALRQVLRQQGVAVTTAGSSATAEGLPGTLLVDAGATPVPQSAWRDLVAGRDRVVIVSPDDAALRALVPAASLRGAPDRDRAAPGCSLALARRAGAMDLSGVERSLRATGATACFRDGAGNGQLVTARRGATRIVLLADRTAFTNERIGQAGNASVALNALGAAPGLVWYTPGPLEFAGAGKQSLQDLTPAWVTPVVALLLLAGVAAALWRGRRLGPVVVERLPVVVRSRETVEGRARLYERGRARLRAADALRIGAIGRMAPLLGLSASAGVDEVADAAARATGTRRDALAALLLTEEPGTDRDLVRVSDDLAALEQRVRAAVLPGGATGGSR